MISMAEIRRECPDTGRPDHPLERPGMTLFRVERGSSISIERMTAKGATQLFRPGLAKVGNPPRADLYSESNEGPVMGIKGRFLRPKLNGRCRIP
jgi:hypothetical protein